MKSAFAAVQSPNSGLLSGVTPMIGRKRFVAFVTGESNNDGCRPRLGVKPPEYGATLTFRASGIVQNRKELARFIRGLPLNCGKIQSLEKVQAKGEPY